MIRVLYRDQVYDCTRSCYMVGMNRLRRRHLGHPVYEDVNGNRFVIVPRES